MAPAPLTPKRVVLNVATWSLWLVTVVAGLIEVYLLRQAFMRLADRAGASASQSLFGGDVVVLVLSLVWLVFAFGTGEFHRRYAGQFRSWQVFGWTVAIQVVLFAVYLVA